MRWTLPCLLFLSFASLVTPTGAQTVYDGPRVETPDIRIELVPVDEERFAVHLTDKTSGLKKSFEFEGEGASDPDTFLMERRRYCGKNVILLTIRFPWRHALPQFQPLLDTYAFDAATLTFADMTSGPLTDITLVDSLSPEAAETDMHPPVLVECLSGSNSTPFRFVRKDGG